jgi:hypothetical protein
MATPNETVERSRIELQPPPRGEHMSKSLIILLLTIGLATGARAQAGPDGVTESTDPARAASVERAVQEMKARMAREAQSGKAQTSAFVVHGQTEGGVAYLSGGITIEDRTKMYAERGSYSLWVATVAEVTGAYLSDAQLRIVDLKTNKVVLERTMDGPWFFATLPSGRYELSATVPPDGSDAAQTRTTRVDIASRGQRQAVLRFPSSAKVSPEMESPFKGNPFGPPPATK